MPMHPRAHFIIHHTSWMFFDVSTILNTNIYAYKKFYKY